MHPRGSQWEVPGTLREARQEDVFLTVNASEDVTRILAAAPATEMVSAVSITY